MANLNSVSLRRNPGIESLFMSGTMSSLRRLVSLLRVGKGKVGKEKLLGRFHSVGKGVEISETLAVVQPERISVGSHVYIGPNTRLDGSGKLDINDHVIIAYEVVIMTSDHNYKNATMVPYDAVELLKPVTIERCVWIGMRSIIMPGVTIGEGSIIGAGSVVTKSCLPGSILGGNPAQVIGHRDMEHYYACVEQEQFYLKKKQAEGFGKQELFT